MAGHAAALLLTLLSVPMLGGLVIFLAGRLPEGGIAFEAGLFGLMLLGSALTAWIVLVPGALVLWFMGRKGWPVALIATLAGMATGALYAQAEPLDTAGTTMFAAMGVVYGMTYGVILHLMAGTADNSHRNSSN